MLAVDGTGSTDEDDGIVSSRWTQLSGTTVALSDPSAPIMTFIAFAVFAASRLRVRQE